MHVLNVLIYNIEDKGSLADSLFSENVEPGSALDVAYSKQIIITCFSDYDRHKEMLKVFVDNFKALT